MEINTKPYITAKGVIEGVQVKWSGFNILLACGKNGFLACGIFDLAAVDSFGVACAIPESTPQNPIGTLERLAERKIAKVNSHANMLGIIEGMSVKEAFEKIV